MLNGTLFCVVWKNVYIFNIRRNDVLDCALKVRSSTERNWFNVNLPWSSSPRIKGRRQMNIIKFNILKLVDNLRPDVLFYDVHRRRQCPNLENTFSSPGLRPRYYAVGPSSVKMRSPGTSTRVWFTLIKGSLEIEVNCARWNDLFGNDSHCGRWSPHSLQCSFTPKQCFICRSAVFKVLIIRHYFFEISLPNPADNYSRMNCFW